MPLYDSSINTSATTWEQWDKKIKAPKSLWLRFEKGKLPETVRRDFQDAAQNLANLLLEEPENRYRYLALLIFLKEHPKINLELLKYASVAVDFRANFTSRNIISLFEVTSGHDGIVKSH